MNASMTAAVLVRHGDHDALEVRRDRPRPTAGDGELVVRVTATAANNTDIYTRRGAFGLPGALGALAGWRGPISFPRILQNIVLLGSPMHTRPPFPELVEVARSGTISPQADTT